MKVHIEFREVCIKDHVINIGCLDEAVVSKVMSNLYNNMAHCPTIEDVEYLIVSTAPDISLIKSSSRIIDHHYDCFNQSIETERKSND